VSATLESSIQNYNLYFRYLTDNLEIALGLMNCTCFAQKFFKCQKWLLLELQKPQNGVCLSQNPPGRVIDVQWYSCLLPSLGLHVACAGVQQSARGEQGRHLAGLVGMGLFPSVHDKPANSTKKMFSWKLPKGKHPLVTPHQRHLDPPNHQQ